MFYWYLFVRDIQCHETNVGKYERNKSDRDVATLRKCHSEYGRHDSQKNISTIPTQIDT